jgi:hypothetical protein
MSRGQELVKAGGCLMGFVLLLIAVAAVAGIGLALR